LVDSYLRLEDVEALRQLLDRWKKNYDDLQGRNSPKNVLEEFRQEIEMIAGAVTRALDGDGAPQTVGHSGVKVLAIDLSMTSTPATASLASQSSESGGPDAVVVTGFTIALSPASPLKPPPER